MRYFILLFLTGSSVTLAAQITKPAMPGRKFEPAGKIYHQPPMIALPDFRLQDKSTVTGEPMIRIFGKPAGDWKAKRIAPDNMPCYLPDLNMVVQIPNSIDEQTELSYIPNAITVKPKARK